jgi:hypothetical protein
MGEQELRLELQSALRDAATRSEGLVLVIDEAHRLNARLLEEIRILSDFAQGGTPLVRVLLSGQLLLEEILAESPNSALNQRIACHVTLAPLSRSESCHYLTSRIERAGASPAATLSPAAIQLIAHVSDGSPRCLNQLADHSLLLGYVAEQKPVGEQLVREALDDLKQLPLQWNDLPASVADRTASAAPQEGAAIEPPAPEPRELDAATDPFAATAEHPDVAEVGVIEVGEPIEPAEQTASQPALPPSSRLDRPESLEREESAQPDGIEEDSHQTQSSIDCESIIEIVQPAAGTRRRSAGEFVVEPVDDLYAALDAAASRSDVSGFVWDLPVGDPAQTAPREADAPASDDADDVPAHAESDAIEDVAPLDDVPEPAGAADQLVGGALPLPADERLVAESDRAESPGERERIVESGTANDIVELVLDAQRAINARVHPPQSIAEQAAPKLPAAMDIEFDVVMPETEGGISKPPHAERAFGRRSDASERPYSRLFGNQGAKAD